MSRRVIGPELFVLPKTWTARLSKLGLIAVGAFSPDALALAGVREADMDEGRSRTRVREARKLEGPINYAGSEPIEIIAAMSNAPVFTGHWIQSVPWFRPASETDATGINAVLLGDGTPVLLLCEEQSLWRYSLMTLPAAAEHFAGAMFGLDPPAPEVIAEDAASPTRGRVGGLEVIWSGRPETIEPIEDQLTFMLPGRGAKEVLVSGATHWDGQRTNKLAVDESGLEELLLRTFEDWMERGRRSRL